jgi:hypothetical protein
MKPAELLLFYTGTDIVWEERNGQDYSNGVARLGGVAERRTAMDGVGGSNVRRSESANRVRLGRAKEDSSSPFDKPVDKPATEKPKPE